MEYDFQYNDIQVIELSFREVLYLGSKPKKLSSEYKDILTTRLFDEISKQKQFFDLKITENVKPLEIDISENRINSIPVVLKNETFDLYQKVETFNQKLVKDVNKIDLNDNLENSSFGVKYISNDKPIFIKSEKISEEQTKKMAFDKTGRLLANIHDELLPDNSIKRMWKDNVIIIKDDQIIYRSKEITFEPMKMQFYNKNKSQIAFPNTRIGSFDMEVYNANGLSNVYALGFYAKFDPEPHMFYIDKEDLDSSKLVFKCLNEMFQPKYDDYTWYCHNSGKYDSVILLKIICEFNDTVPENEQIAITTVNRKSTILKLQLTKTVKNRKYKITICDSYAIFTDSLKKLAIRYGVPTLKGSFPHRFVNDKTLFYIGNTPDILYYDDVSIVDYNRGYSDDWSLKESCLVYLKKDLHSLYEIVSSANNSVHHNFHIQMTNCLTASSLASDIFMKNFVYNKTTSLPYINSHNIYNDIHNAYFGGITEVYITYGEDLKYYDVNSLYPYAAYKAMPELKCTKLTFYEPTEDIDNFFGFFYCKIKTPYSDYLGLLPLKTGSGLNFPLGCWEGWYFSEELKFVKENGYSVTILKGYNFSKVDRVFDEYIHDIYKLKANPVNKSQKSIAKSLLNNLLGRFGISLDKPMTEVVSDKRFDTISMMHKVMGYKHIAITKTEKRTQIICITSPKISINLSINNSYKKVLIIVGYEKLCIAVVSWQFIVINFNIFNVLCIISTYAFNEIFF